MKRRPHIPLKVRCIVAARQIGYDAATLPLLLDDWRGKYATLLKKCLDEIRKKVGEDNLQLDHDPALVLREYFPKTGKWSPDANDPDFLIYRAQDGDHRVKTTIRGAHGARSDISEMVYRRRVAKRAEERRTGKKKKFNWPKGRKLQGRGFQKRIK